MNPSKRIQEIMDLEHFKTMTPIQQEVLKYENSNRDLIGISSTGSGKSHAFFFPIFDQLDLEKDEVQAVISAPTRELAFQLYSRCKTIAKHFGARVKLVTGGMERKEIGLQPQIVIGTPGRMKDLFIQENELRLDTAQLMVIDEADMTLEFGFLEDVDVILSKMPKNLRLMVFSATIPNALHPFLQKYLHDPVWIQIDENKDYQSDVTHYLVPCKHKSYQEKLLDVLPAIQPYVCLIFCNTTAETKATADFLRANGYDLVELHGDLESRQRLQAIKTIESQQKTYIVASDIASRGIDIEGITHVISCGFPRDLKFYIHRAGRTGRVQRDGICIALYQKSDRNAILSLMRKGIAFHHKDVKNNTFVDLKPYVDRKPPKKDDPLEQEINKIVHRKKQKVKPNYKKKQRQEIERLKRKRKREIIQKDIQRQKKERAIEKQRAKGKRS